MTEWQERTLSEVVTVINGDRGRNYPSAVHRTTEGIPFVNAGLLVDGRVRPGGSNFITRERFELLRSGRLEVGDVVLCIRGSIGRAAMVTPDVVPGAIASSLVILRPGPDLSPRFLLALLQSPVGQQQISSNDNGAAQPNVGAQTVAGFRFLLPERRNQEEIVRVLDSIEGLIENNRRRVEVLEETARTIYREWFVHFRYPSHEDAIFVDSTLGPIPNGWVAKKIVEISTSVTRGVAPKYAEDGPWTVLNQRCIRDGRVSLDKARRQERNVPPHKRVQFGDVLVNSTGVGTLGRAALCLTRHPALTADSHVTIIRPAEGRLHPWFGLTLLARQSELESLGTGSTGQTELSRHDVGALSVAYPPAEILDSFAQAVRPLLAVTPTLLEESQRLASIRDLLLPRLVTGQIDVSSLDLDTLTEEAVA